MAMGEAPFCALSLPNQEFLTVSAADDDFEVESPCISQCGLDPATLSCPSCGRTIEEIRAWKLASNAEKLEILAALARRRAEQAAG